MEKILGEREKRRKQMKDLGLLHNTFQPLVSIAERNSMADQVSTIEQKPPLVGWIALLKASPSDSSLHQKLL